MERLTNRDKEIPLPNADNALFWARVHEKLARYEDAEEQAYFASKPQTNADRIRAMTDEELDKFLGEVQWDVANYCGGVTQKQEYPVPEQRGAWLDWLKKEVEECKSK